MGTASLIVLLSFLLDTYIEHMSALTLGDFKSLLLIKRAKKWRANEKRKHGDTVHLFGVGFGDTTFRLQYSANQREH